MFLNVSVCHVYIFRDVSSVELLMKYHQGIRAEIDARGPKFNDCVELAGTLLAHKHKDSDEVIRYCSIIS